MPQPPPALARVGQVDEHVDALLLDAERRDFRDAERLDQAHLRVQGALAAPARDEHGVAGRDFHGLGRQQVDDDFEIGGIADFGQRLARLDDGLVLVQHAQDLSG